MGTATSTNTCSRQARGRPRTRRRTQRSFIGVTGHLATITSFGENEVVGSLKGATNDPARLDWADGRGHIEGTFQWVTGEPFGVLELGSRRA